LVRKIGLKPDTKIGADMWNRIKGYIIIAAVAGLVYFILSSHFIFYGPTNIRILKKDRLELHYTFFSLKNKLPDQIMRNDAMRRKGIGEIMVEFGICNRATMEKLQEKYEGYDYEDENEN
jgi:hypothetical protein